MNRFVSRLTSSQRGEGFNPLTWPFFIATLAYGLGFLALTGQEAVFKSSLYITMYQLWPPLPLIWGAAAILTILMGFTFLMFNIPPAGKVSGLIGFMIWLFAAFCWFLSGSWVTLFSIALPNMYFWIWQYLSLSLFRREDALDKRTLADYNAGFYDDMNPDIDSRQARLDNRGRDRQEKRRYDGPDDGLDESRPL